MIIKIHVSMAIMLIVYSTIFVSKERSIDRVYGSSVIGSGHSVTVWVQVIIAINIVCTLQSVLATPPLCFCHRLTSSMVEVSGVWLRVVHPE